MIESLDRWAFSIDDSKLSLFVARPFLTEGTHQERTQLMNVIRQIELETTFDALGFFKIELSTLTSLGSTIMTYLIILAQFNSSPTPTSTTTTTTTTTT